MAWIGVDLDGTLAHHDSGDGIQRIGAPVPAMVERVKQWLKDGIEVRIVTARMSGKVAHRHRQRTMIKAWTTAHVGQPLEATNEKDLNMLQLWDDRAVSVKRNEGVPYEGVPH